MIAARFWRSIVGAIVRWLWRLVVLPGFGGSARGLFG